MARQFQSVVFANLGGTDRRYTADRGARVTYNGRFVIPPDITEAEAEAIATAAGGGTEKADIPCPAVDFEPRKLVFIRQSGNSISVPIGARTNLQAAETTIRGILNKQNNAVVCTKLTGEYWAVLNDELGVSLAANEVAVDSRPANGLKQYVHSGIIAYESDVFAGAVVFTPVKVNTDVDGSPPTNVGAVWDTCVGDFEGFSFSCGNTARNHRRYLLDFVLGTVDNTDPANPVTNRTGSERKEVPVKNNEAAEILTCGQNLATLTGLYCLGYQGESYARVYTAIT